MFVAQVIFIIKIFRPHGTFLDAGAALNANTRHFGNILRINRSHGTNFGAELAFDAIAVCLGRNLEDADGITVWVPGPVIFTVRGIPLYDNTGNCPGFAYSYHKFYRQNRSPLSYPACRDGSLPASLKMSARR